MNLKLTDNVGQGECLAEKVAIGPPVVMFKVVDQVVEQQFLLLFLFHFGANANVQVHHQGVDLARLPVLPQPTRHIKQDGLSQNNIIRDPDQLSTDPSTVQLPPPKMDQIVSDGE